MKNEMVGTNQRCFCPNVARVVADKQLKSEVFEFHCLV